MYYNINVTAESCRHRLRAYIDGKCDVSLLCNRCGLDGNNRGDY